MEISQELIIPITQGLFLLQKNPPQGSYKYGLPPIWLTWGVYFIKQTLNCCTAFQEHTTIQGFNGPPVEPNFCYVTENTLKFHRRNVCQAKWSPVVCLDESFAFAVIPFSCL